MLSDLEGNDQIGAPIHPRYRQMSNKMEVQFNLYEGL
jgi:hypothetical protein